jgi:hypothetical protein
MIATSTMVKTLAYNTLKEIIIDKRECSLQKMNKGRLGLAKDGEGSIEPRLERAKKKRLG